MRRLRASAIATSGSTGGAWWGRRLTQPEMTSAGPRAYTAPHAEEESCKVEAEFPGHFCRGIPDCRLRQFRGRQGAAGLGWRKHRNWRKHESRNNCDGGNNACYDRFDRRYGHGKWRSGRSGDDSWERRRNDDSWERRRNDGCGRANQREWRRHHRDRWHDDGYGRANHCDWRDSHRCCGRRSRRLVARRSRRGCSR
jgi:hypothetical protein